MGAEANGGSKGSVAFVWLGAVAIEYVCAAELIDEVELSELMGVAEMVEPAVDEAILEQADTTNDQLQGLPYRIERLTSNRRQNSRRACWRWLYQVVSFN